MLCPACHEENPDRNRFCGQCGTPLRAGVHDQVSLDGYYRITRQENPDRQPLDPATRTTAATAADSIDENGKRERYREYTVTEFRDSNHAVAPPPQHPSLQAEILDYKRKVLGDNARDDLQANLAGQSGEFVRGSSALQPARPHPPEVVEYDKRVPLLAETGTDRRRSADSIRQAMRAANEAFAGDPAFVAPLNSPTAGELGLDGMSAEGAPGNEIVTNNVDKPAEDEAHDRPSLSRFLDFDEELPHSSVSGPSFLGLSGETAEEVDEVAAGGMRARWFFALAVLAALGVLAFLQRHQLYDAGVHYAQSGTAYIQQIKRGRDAAQPTSTTLPNRPANENAGGQPEMTVDPARVPSEPPATATTPAPETAAKAVAPDDTTTNAATADEESAAAKSLPATERASPKNDTPAQADITRTPAPTSETKPANSAGAKAPPASPGGRELASNTQPATRELPQQNQPHGPSSPRLLQQPEAPKPVPGQSEYQQALIIPDQTVARSLLWRATSLGNPDAPVRLADIYIYGQGVPQNCEQGLVLLRSAAQKPNARARTKLGALYATGKCVPLNRVEAYRWISLALQVSPDSDWILTNRETVWRRMSSSERAMVASLAH